MFMMSTTNRMNLEMLRRYLILVPTSFCGNNCKGYEIEQTCPNISTASDGDFDTRSNS